METSVSNANLNVAKGKLKQKFASLTDDDLLLEEGRKEEIIGNNQAMIYQTKTDLDQMLATI